MFSVVTPEIIRLIFRPAEVAAISASTMSNGGVHCIDGASHWVNADKPEKLIKQ